MAVFAKLINISATALLLITASCSDERFNDTIIDPDALPGDRDLKRLHIKNITIAEEE